MDAIDVAFISPTLSGGVGKVTITLAEEMHNRGMTVEIWTLDEQHQCQFNSDIQIRTIPADHAKNSLLKIICMLNKNKPRNAFSASYHLNCVVILAKILSRSKTNLAIVEHTSLTNGLETLSLTKKTVARLSIAILYRFANTLIGVSKDVARQMEQHAFLPKNYSKIIYNPVINDKLYDASFKEMLHPFSFQDGKIFLSVGRLSKEKDIPTLLKAFAKTIKIKPASMIIAGDGPEKSNIYNLILDLGLENHVALLGHVSNPYPLFRQADVFVLSSTREGLPTVLIEALALGCIVVSTDARSGPREILEDGKLGLLVPPSDLDILASAMIKGLEQSNQRSIVPNSSLSKYSVDYAVDQYIGCLTVGTEPNVCEDEK